MGDIIEITTWPKHRHIFYKVNSSSINFEVKADNAAVGLAKEAGMKCDYWVVLGDRSFIHAPNSGIQFAHTPNIISNSEYRKFWISWSKNGVCLGQNGELEPIMKLECKEQNFNYFTFSMHRSIAPAHWRFELPPPQIKRPLKRVEGGKLQWIKYEDSMPKNAVCGGHEHEMLFVARGGVRGSLTPGKYVSSKAAVFIPWGGTTYKLTNVEILCGYDCVWTPSWADNIPVGAVEAGYSEVDREPLYVGRVKHNGFIIPGKVQPSHKVCYIPYKNEEKAFKYYEILIEPNQYPGFAYDSLIPSIKIDIEPNIDDDRNSNNYDEENDEGHYYSEDDEDYNA